MDSYTLKVYPHKYMDRSRMELSSWPQEIGVFQADSIAYDVSQLVLHMLMHSNVLYKNLSSNEGYEFEIHNPNCGATIEVVDKILLIFPEVSKRKAWIEFPIQPKRKLTNIDRCFLEDEMQTDAELGYDEFNLDEI